MGDDFILGMDAHLYFADYAETPADPDDMAEISNVRDLTLSLESAEADHTTRANAGWRATARTLRECTVEFEMVWKPSDLGFQAVRDAYLAKNGLVHLLVLDQAREIAGAEGINADFAITRFNRTEPVEDVEKVAVTAKLSRYISWVQIGSES